MMQVDYDHDLVRDELSKAVEVCGSRISKAGFDHILDLITQQGFTTHEAVVSIVATRDEGRITWSELLKKLRAARRDRIHKKKTEREIREAQEEAEYGSIDSQPCQNDHKCYDCGKLRCAEISLAVQAAFGRIAAGEKKNNILAELARAFPGAGFERYGTPAYNDLYGKGMCQYCRTGKVKTENQENRCEACKRKVV